MLRLQRRSGLAVLRYRFVLSPPGDLGEPRILGSHPPLARGMPDGDVGRRRRGDPAPVRTTLEAPTCLGRESLHCEVAGINKATNDRVVWKGILVARGKECGVETEARGNRGA